MMVCDFVDGNYKCFVHRTRHPTTACLVEGIFVCVSRLDPQSKGEVTWPLVQIQSSVGGSRLAL